MLLLLLPQTQQGRHQHPTDHSFLDGTGPSNFFLFFFGRVLFLWGDRETAKKGDFFSFAWPYPISSLSHGRTPSPAIRMAVPHLQPFVWPYPISSHSHGRIPSPAIRMAVPISIQKKGIKAHAERKRVSARGCATHPPIHPSTHPLIRRCSWRRVILLLLVLVLFVCYRNVSGRQDKSNKSQ